MSAVMRGRPPAQLTDEIAAYICDQLANGDKPLTGILADWKGGPSWAVVTRWEAESPIFREALARARVSRLERMADSLVTLADQGIEQPQKVKGLKLAVDTRQWLLSKLLSDTYGDKLDLTSKGESITQPAHQIDARIQSIVLTAQRRAAGDDGLALCEEASKLLE